MREHIFWLLRILAFLMIRQLLIEFDRELTSSRMSRWFRLNSHLSWVKKIASGEIIKLTERSNARKKVLKFQKLEHSRSLIDLVSTNFQPKQASCFNWFNFKWWNVYFLVFLQTLRFCIKNKLFFDPTLAILDVVSLTGNFELLQASMKIICRPVHTSTHQYSV